MNANKRELILKDEVYSVVSCSMEIINGLGHGLHEKPYENALAVEFEHRGIPYEQQKAFPVNWRGQRVGQFIPDLIAYNQIAVDIKNHRPHHQHRKWPNAQLSASHPTSTGTYHQFQTTKTPMGTDYPKSMNHQIRVYSCPFAVSQS